MDSVLTNTRMMNKVKPNPHVFIMTILALASYALSAQETPNPKLVVTGAMRETMWNGQLSGLIDLDSLKWNRELFGLGPVEYLQGEIMLLGEVSHVSRIAPGGSTLLDNRFDVKAPFFVHACVDEWRPFRLPKSVMNLEHLEAFLDSETKTHPRPFAFQLKGRIRNAVIHIMNVPSGTKVNEPADAHRHQVDYELENEAVRILGFFSTQHQRIFTHHDTFLHLHLITSDSRIMGHMDALEFMGDEMELHVGY